MGYLSDQTLALFYLRLVLLLFEAGIEEVKSADSSRIFDIQIDILVIWMVDHVAVGLVDHDGVANIASNVVQSCPGDQQSQFDDLLLVEFKAEMVLGDAFPVEVVCCSLYELHC